ncbi:MAG: histidine phosphatase family protein [Clostridium sp.]|nr:histidine phosphatase family protein [Clostridium sp.]
MTTVYITRHGQTLWNIDYRFQGQKDSELTEKGINQAKLLSERMKDVHIDCIYASPLKRTVETAKVIRGDRNIEIIKEDGFRELSFGDYEGRTKEELVLEGKGKEITDIFNYVEEAKAPNGESLKELYDRVSKTLDSVLDKQKGKTIFIVTHGAALLAIYKYFSEENKYYPKVMSQTSLTKVVDKGEGFKFEYVNDIQHLE